MDIEFVKKSARQFAYQLRKFFPEDESPINHYVCKNHVLVLSTKKLYVYYYDQFIDYVGDVLQKVECEVQESATCKIVLNKKQFDVEFASDKELNAFIRYYNKYR